jgi:hypothetical protein
MSGANLPAGRELDAALSLALTGFPWCRGPVRELRLLEEIVCVVCGPRGKGWPDDRHVEPLHYSAYISDAWALVEAMEQRGWRLVRLSREAFDDNTREWFAHFERFEDEGKPWFQARQADAWGDTAPEALCRAALAALTLPTPAKETPHGR